MDNRKITKNDNQEEIINTQPSKNQKHYSNNNPNDNSRNNSINNSTNNSINNSRNNSKANNYEVVVLGATGNFGRIITKTLAENNISLLIAARREQPLLDLKTKLCELYSDLQIECTTCAADYNEVLQLLQKHQPLLLINASGPFQSASYAVAEACIAAGVNYVDLADGREFVTGITSLNAAATAAKVSVISGASTVPALSSAVIEHLKPQFSRINSLRYGIATGAKTPRGLATTQAILSYIGRPIKCLAKFPEDRERYGWQDVYRQNYPELGNRWMANCDIPDLDLFTKYYAIEQIQFSAGMQSALLHFCVWICSWIVRCFPALHLEKHAKSLLSFSHLFDCLGNADGGMHLILKGVSNSGDEIERKWFIIANDGDGIRIPTIPSVYIAKQIVQQHKFKSGAYPCVGIVPLDKYLQELDGCDIQVFCE